MVQNLVPRKNGSILYFPLCRFSQPFEAVRPRTGKHNGHPTLRIFTEHINHLCTNDLIFSFDRGCSVFSVRTKKILKNCNFHTDINFTILERIKQGKNIWLFY